MPSLWSLFFFYRRRKAEACIKIHLENGNDPERTSPDSYKKPELEGTGTETQQKYFTVQPTSHPYPFPFLAPSELDASQESSGFQVAEMDSGQNRYPVELVASPVSPVEPLDGRPQVPRKDGQCGSGRRLGS